MPSPHKDAIGQPIDIGDWVKFINDGPYGTIFRIVQFTHDGSKALIFASTSRKYWTPLERIKWVR
jgi:hypothetical protein